jgi:hypothetical protein
MVKVDLFFQLRCQKSLATKTQRHEKKNATHFPLSPGVLVANSIFYKNCFSTFKILFFNSQTTSCVLMYNPPYTTPDIPVVADS